MSAGDTSRVLRAPGRLVVNPTRDFAGLAEEFPYGGTEIGKTKMCSVTPSGRAPFLVQYEALGSVGDVLENDTRIVFACFVRAWDRDAVRMFLAEGYVQGDQTQHAVYSVPGTLVPGSSALDRSVVLVYIPDDPINVPAVLMHRAVPNWTNDAELALRRGDEFGLPITFECIRDESGRIMQIGRLADLEL